MNIKQREAKKKDLEMLKKWAEMGLITLKYLDESGVYPESPLVYWTLDNAKFLTLFWSVSEWV